MRELGTGAPTSACYVRCTTAFGLADRRHRHGGDGCGRCDRNDDTCPSDGGAALCQAPRCSGVRHRALGLRQKCVQRVRPTPATSRSAAEIRTTLQGGACLPGHPIFTSSLDLTKPEPTGGRLRFHAGHSPRSTSTGGETMDAEGGLISRQAESLGTVPLELTAGYLRG
jgi:hypothetical protein